jgi:hypothetical protein
MSNLIYYGSGLSRNLFLEKTEQPAFEWKNRPKKYGKKHHQYFRETLHKAGIESYEIIHDDSGFWIYFEK